MRDAGSGMVFDGGAENGSAAGAASGHKAQKISHDLVEIFFDDMAGRNMLQSR